MESIFTFVVLLASLQYALSDVIARLLLALIKTKPREADPIDSRVEVRFMANHYRGE